MDRNYPFHVSDRSPQGILQEAIHRGEGSVIQGILRLCHLAPDADPDVAGYSG